MCLKLGIPPSNGQLKTGQSDDDDWIILDLELMSIFWCQYFDAYAVQIVKLGMVQHNWGITTLNLFQAWYLFSRAIQLDETPHPACTGCRNRRNRTPWRSELFLDRRTFCCSLLSKTTNLVWLVVDLPLWKIWKSNGSIIPNIWNNKKGSKPPTSYNRNIMGIEYEYSRNIMGYHNSIW